MPEEIATPHWHVEVCRPGLGHPIILPAQYVSREAAWVAAERMQRQFQGRGAYQAASRRCQQWHAPKRR